MKRFLVALKYSLEPQQVIPTLVIAALVGLIVFSIARGDSFRYAFLGGIVGGFTYDWFNWCRQNPSQPS